MARALKAGQVQLETTTRITLAVLALASGVYTYLGVRGLLSGTTTVVFFGAVIYSVAVSVGIYAFWTYLIRFLPHMQNAASRGWLFVAMAIGSVMIIAMSSWLNAAALAGSAALEQHMANATETYQQQLDQANSNALAAQSLLPDIQLASRKFSNLAAQERSTGALTGTSGSGTVVQLLSQMSGQLDGLGQQIEESKDDLKRHFDQGGRHLSRMRELISNSGPIEARANAFSEEALKLTGEIAALQQTSVAPAVKRAAEDLGKSFIAPVADGRDASLQERQTEVVSRVEQAVRSQSRALARAADEILSVPSVVPARFQPLSPPEAVLVYATDFLPSWAGAISIDLLPAVLIFIMCIVEGAIRRHEGEELDAESMTAGDLMRALKVAQKIDEELQVAPVASLLNSPSTTRLTSHQSDDQATVPHTPQREEKANVTRLEPTVPGRRDYRGDYAGE